MKRTGLSIFKKATLTASGLLLTASSYAQYNDAVDGQEVLEEIDVTAEALKVEVPVEEMPISVSVINEADLKEHNPRKIDEVLRYTSGVLSAPYGTDNDFDWFKIRGFDATSYYNGSRLYQQGYFGWQIEPFGLESVEVIKGSATMLYGDSKPGGAVNLVSKKPLNYDYSMIETRIGQNNLKQIGLDVSRLLTEEGDISARFVSMMNKSDGELDGTHMERYYFAPSIQFDFSGTTQLTLLADFKKDRGVPTNGFFPAYGSLIGTPEGHIDTDTNLGEPDYDLNRSKQSSVGYEFSHAFNDTWRVEQNGRLGFTDLTLRSVYAFPSADSTDPYRGIVYRDGDTKSANIDTKVLGNWYTNGMEHNFLAGIEAQGHQTTSRNLDDYSFGQINTLDPQYGNYTPINKYDATRYRIEKSQLSAYAQHRLTLDNGLSGVAGLRYDRVDVNNKNRTDDIEKDFNQGHTSYNAGLMYLSETGFSPYISYSDSYEVLVDIDPATNELYKPLKGRQVEIGAKYVPTSMDGYVNIALFDLHQDNALVTNPDTFVATQTGTVKSKGLEIEGALQLTDAVKLSGSYTYTRARTEDTGGRGEQQAAMIPKHMGTLWGDYSFSDGLEGLKIGTGLRYIGSSFDNPKSSELKVDGQLLWDMAVQYRVNKNLEFQFNVNNILDEEYVASCDYYCYYGERRKAMATMRYTW